MLGDRAIDVSAESTCGVHRWYVCRRWRSAYEHDADGNPVAGNLDDLMHCVRTGQTIRVGVRQLFGLNEDDDTGPAHTCFLTTMQPLIRDRRGGLLLIGLLNGLLPCGLVYMGLVASLATGGVWQGMAYMAVFGAGTLPLMLATVLVGRVVRPR